MKYGSLGHLRVTQIPNRPALSVAIMTDDIKCLYPLTKNVRQMLDLNTDPLVIGNTFQVNKHLNNLYKKNPGLRLSRFWDPYEGAVCTILGQLVSLAQARRLVKRLVENYGEIVTSPRTGDDVRLFPTPETLAQAKIEEIGTTRIRANAIRELCEKVLDRSIVFDSGREYDLLRKKLLSIKGIGAWTADYIALRALGEPDVFPSDDLVLKRSVTKHSDINIDDAKPYRSYLALHLWHEH